MEVGTDVEISARKSWFESELNIELIKPSRHNPRKTFDEILLEELADSIRENGIIEPLVVRPIDVRLVDDIQSELDDVVHEVRNVADRYGMPFPYGADIEEHLATYPEYSANFEGAHIDGHGQLVVALREERRLSQLGISRYYELVAGERRLRAAQMAGLDVVPAMVRELTEDEALEQAIIENEQREDLNPVERALGFKALRDRGHSNEAIAQRLGLSKAQSTISNSIRILELPAVVLDRIRSGEWTLSHGKALLSYLAWPELFKAMVTRAETGCPVKVLESVPFDVAARLSQNGNAKLLRPWASGIDVDKCRGCHDRKELGNDDFLCLNMQCYAERRAEHLAANQARVAEAIGQPSVATTAEVVANTREQLEEATEHSASGDGNDSNGIEDVIVFNTTDGVAVIKLRRGDGGLWAYDCDARRLFADYAGIGGWTKPEYPSRCDALREALGCILRHFQRTDSTIWNKKGFRDRNTVLVNLAMDFALRMSFDLKFDPEPEQTPALVEYAIRIHPNHAEIINELACADEPTDLAGIFLRGLAAVCEDHDVYQCEACGRWLHIDMLESDSEGVNLCLDCMDEESVEPATVTAYLQDGYELFVHCGLSEFKNWGTFKRKKNCALKRIVSNAMPMVPDRAEAQANLDRWAKGRGLEAVQIPDPCVKPEAAEGEEAEAETQPVARFVRRKEDRYDVRKVIIDSGSVDLEDFKGRIETFTRHQFETDWEELPEAEGSQPFRDESEECGGGRRQMIDARCAECEARCAGVGAALPSLTGPACRESKGPAGTILSIYKVGDCPRGRG